LLLSPSSSTTPSLSSSSSSLTTGEAFDKAARLLGLRGKSSGGVAIEQQAELYRNNMYNGSLSYNRPISSGLTIPMRDKPNCDFSYAGTSSLYHRCYHHHHHQDYHHHHQYCHHLISSITIISIIVSSLLSSFTIFFYYHLGLKNSFRIAVQAAREEYGSYQIYYHIMNSISLKTASI
jgi:tRNA A37 threonylcarbamoyltransferase TsaD